MNKKFIFTFLSIAWMIIIFCFSNQEAIDSTEMSNSFIDNTIIKIYRFFDEDATEEQVKEVVDIFFVPVRKSAHFVVYFVLGILILFTLKAYDIKNDLIVFSFLLCFLYAVSDEFHQLFVAGRCGSVKDVLLDTFGSLIGILCFKKKV